MVYRAWSLEGRRLETRPLTDSIPDMELGLLWEDNALTSGPVQALHQFFLYAGHNN
jgi:hypothetical protein